MNDGEARTRVLLVLAVAVLLAGAVSLRVMHLGTMPGVSGDEGWWGVQARAWAAGQAYERQTTSGNPTDLLLLVPLALLHRVAGPSFGVLRAIPAAVNLLALPIGFWFVRRVYGAATAWIFTVMLAILPTAIAHSRICQDPSQSVFWTLAVMGLSLCSVADPRRKWTFAAAAAAAFPLTLWTHPTNVFIGAFPAIALVLASGWSPRRVGALAVVAAVGVAAAVLYFGATNPYLARALASAQSRLFSPRDWIEFAVNNVRLFNGITVYHYFSGARPWTLPYDASFALAIAVLPLALARHCARYRTRTDAVLLAAGAAMWAGFFVFAGPQALRPHAERWGLCLLAPGALLAARGLAVALDAMPRLRQSALLAASLAGLAVLASFHRNYFVEFERTGGRGHLTYVTAPVEPKQQALQRVLESGRRPVTIATQQWWLYWPIAYLAGRHPEVTVRRGLPDPRDPAASTFLVEFVSTAEAEAAEQWMAVRGLAAGRSLIADAGGVPLIEVVGPIPSGSSGGTGGEAGREAIPADGGAPATPAHPVRAGVR